MRILVLTYADEAYRDIGRITAPNKQMYADKHGYGFHNEFEPFGGTNRPASWNKIPYLLQYFPFYEWIFWTDADSLIMNSSIRIEDFVIDTEQDLLIAKDGNGINAGHFIIRSCPWSVDFLQKVWNSNEFINHPWWEQAAIAHLLNDPTTEAHVKYLAQSQINSAPNIYKDGDFVLHFSGHGGPRRNFLIDSLKHFSQLAI